MGTLCRDPTPIMLAMATFDDNGPLNQKKMETRKGKTLVLGASTNPERYSHMAVLMLRSHGLDVVAVGPKPGRIGDVDIVTEMPSDESVDTVTLYLNPTHQAAYADRILGLHPRRIVFNPGTENPGLEDLATQKGIQAQRACTLVLLSTGQY